MRKFLRFAVLLLPLALVACGGGGGGSDDSDDSGTSVTAPSITTQPSSVTTAAGSQASFSVVASGSGLSYQWYKDGTAISGATEATYTIASVTASDAGSYHVVVSNSAASVTSSTAALTVGTTTGGTDTSAVVVAAQAFTATLSSTQLATAQRDFTLANARVWTNLPVTSRSGIKLGDLTGTPLSTAVALLQTALGDAGYTLFEEVRLGDEVIHQTNAGMAWGYDLYYVAILGTPSTTSPWALQITGHHLAYNIIYNGDYVSATPTFLGVEPTNWSDSSGVAHAPLDTQRAAVQSLAASLQADSSAASTAMLSGSFTDVVMGPTSNGDTAYPLTYPTGTSGRGVAYSALSSAQQGYVKAAIEAWVHTQSSEVASALLAEYESDAALASTYVGYGLGASGTADFGANPSGITSRNSYLRIDGPRVWIEFVVQQGVAYPSEVHYHTIWRDKVADYGGCFSTGANASAC